jgi:DNA-binding GntR family transcriptional regulator
MRIYEVGAGPRTMKIIHTLWMLFPWDTLDLVVSGDCELASVSAVTQHERILGALRDGTAEEAGEAMAAHIRHGREMLRHYMAARPKERA